MKVLETLVILFECEDACTGRLVDRGMYDFHTYLQDTYGLTLAEALPAAILRAHGATADERSLSRVSH